MWCAERYPRTQMGSDMISWNANGEWATQNILWCTKQYSKIDVFWCWWVCTCIQKILVQLMTQPKIADTSKTHQKLVPVCIRGVPVCVRGVRQKNSHMGRRITHNEIVRIRGLTYTRCIMLKKKQNTYLIKSDFHTVFFWNVQLSGNTPLRSPYRLILEKNWYYVSGNSWTFCC